MSLGYETEEIRHCIIPVIEGATEAATEFMCVCIDRHRLETVTIPDAGQVLQL